MTAKQLIARLQAIVDEHGDLPLVLDGPFWSLLKADPEVVRLATNSNYPGMFLEYPEEATKPYIHIDRGPKK